ncbi:MAG: KilA-N domain-containing protein [Lachnospiraceae bacterium]|nr:KilA-N domain-containing protein [Lachnospiraceae bacterium]
MAKNRIITVQNIPITISEADLDDYICITDMAAAKSESSRAADVVRNWLRNRTTLEYLSTWEEIYNPNFKVFESEHFKKQAGLLTFTPSVSEWVNQTGAIGLFVKKGRYGGTFAHKDIAFEFASAISPVFKLYLIKEFQRLKEQENDIKKIEWSAKRFLSKNNYLIQTDAVKNYLIPVCNYRENLQWLPYAEEADLLNVALFGFTAKAWRDANPELAKHSNIRDYSSINELTVLSNLETHNAQMIREGKSKEQRFSILKEIAEYQINILNEAQNISNRDERIKQVTNPPEQVIIKRAGVLRQIDYGGKKNDKLEKS